MNAPNNPRIITILLVEDNEADVKITTRAFSQTRFKNRVLVVNNGQECLDYLRRQGRFTAPSEHPVPDLVLLDLSMPMMDGFAVLKTLKADPHLSRIPVVVLTASGNEDDIRRSYEAGASGYIQKPVAYEEFLKVVDGFDFYWHINQLPKKEA